MDRVKTLVGSGIEVTVWLLACAPGELDLEEGTARFVHGRG